MTLILTFLAGFAFELTYLVWLYLADAARPGPAALMAGVVMAFSLSGYSSGIKSVLTGASLCLGCSAGSYVAAKWKQRRARLESHRMVREALAYRPPPIVIENDGIAQPHLLDTAWAREDWSRPAISSNP